jgi:hypothetical protein
MKKRDYLGKRIDVDRLQNCSDNFSFPEEIEEGESYYYDDGQYTKAEIFLNEFELNDCYDANGYNFYSLKIVVDVDKVIKLIRVAHCHMCGNEGSDDELSRYPYNSLEVEAGAYLDYCTTF